MSCTTWKSLVERRWTALERRPEPVGGATMTSPATLVIDLEDEPLAAEVEAQGVRCVVTDTIMRSVTVSAALARTAIAAAGTVDPGDPASGGTA